MKKGQLLHRAGKGKKGLVNLEIIPPAILGLGGESKESSKEESGVGEASFAEQKQFGVFQARWRMAGGAVGFFEPFLGSRGLVALNGAARRWILRYSSVWLGTQVSRPKKSVVLSGRMISLPIDSLPPSFSCR